jgi:predicted transcriptional regulator
MQNSPGNIEVRQIKAARALLEWSQSDMAANSGVSLPTIHRLEAAGGLLGGAPSTIDKIVSCLEVAGVEFIPENGGGAGVRLRKSQT